MLLPIHKTAGVGGYLLKNFIPSTAAWMAIDKTESALRDKSGIPYGTPQAEARAISPIGLPASDAIKNFAGLAMLPKVSLGSAAKGGLGIAGANAIDAAIGGPGNADQALIDMDPNSAAAKLWGVRRMISGAVGGIFGGIHPIIGGVANMAPELYDVGIDTLKNNATARATEASRLEGNAKLFPHIPAATLEGMNTDRMRESLRNRSVAKANAAQVAPTTSPTPATSPTPEAPTSPWNAVLLGLGLGAGGYALSSMLSKKDEEEDESVRKVGFIQYVTEGLPVASPRRWIKASASSSSYYSSSRAFNNPPQPNDLTVPNQIPPTHSLTGSLPGMVAPTAPGAISMPPDQSIKVPKAPNAPKMPTSNSKTVSTTGTFTSTL